MFEWKQNEMRLAAEYRKSIITQPHIDENRRLYSQYRNMKELADELSIFVKSKFMTNVIEYLSDKISISIMQEINKAILGDKYSIQKENNDKETINKS